jgi:hypothetical protein
MAASAASMFSSEFALAAFRFSFARRSSSSPAAAALSLGALRWSASRAQALVCLRLTHPLAGRLGIQRREALVKEGFNVVNRRTRGALGKLLEETAPTSPR